MCPSWILEILHLILLFLIAPIKTLMHLSARTRTLMLVLAMTLHLWMPDGALGCHCCSRAGVYQKGRLFAKPSQMRPNPWSFRRESA